MATTRLRKTFRYPDDVSPDAPPEGLDEQEQESLIETLKQQDEARNAFYTKAFLCLPILASLLCIPLLFRPSITTAGLFEALGSILSMACSAYLLYFQPLPLISRKDRSQPLWTSIIGDSLETQVPLGFCLLHALLAFLKPLLFSAEKDDVLTSFFPAVVSAVTLVVRFQLRPVDVEELEGLKYEYKGA
ncbi:hypothetical protein K402DRAFT_40800 [Aulographum hederae CBS 113979]|uniref:Uncharacterized protein n=1 Tax=Aulographum hederae CBS 113979 TaxID=1176131 RepID=A0A6G1H4W7_9PEZI|nr:hypothetical protein K402DRAFT_40800 [Aulographum hederae CBS 113979]